MFKKEFSDWLVANSDATKESIVEKAGMLFKKYSELPKLCDNEMTACFQQYKHDCNLCSFLGRYMGADLYFCNSLTPNIIARMGNDGGDYSSGIIFGVINHEGHLREALIRSLKRPEFRKRITENFYKYETDPDLLSKFTSLVNASK